MNKEVLLDIKGLYKNYFTSSLEIKVLDNIDLTINKGEFVCLLGPSGCGKTTLLRIIAGLEKQTKGSIKINGQNIKGPSHERALVFQEPRLFPWLSVEDNVAFGLKGRVSKDSWKKVVEECIELMGLTAFSKAYPHELSGGMAQRLSIARALVVNPEILLLDEPFSSLDAITKMRLQEEVHKLWKTTGKTMIMVTHDIDEALKLGQRLLIMSAAPAKIIREFRLRKDLTSENIDEIKSQIIKCLI